MPFSERRVRKLDVQPLRDGVDGPDLIVAPVIFAENTGEYAGGHSINDAGPHPLQHTSCKSVWTG
ncbi:hypothetical protein MYSTI_01594 [Myxococcus stipitatus DSM 14675]|uniref:Uncharacterized protein n=1 Tax=Myxococcus stipitatus (strain DSM 14675 / JCM 12634 / Mx s8) TaxID=1278073 RepID=L7U5T2_MYXSD|nr:hypothetical protein [Myxococcus stipitatus]AGC42927.1 hypothetical protein MYSTI_01594 [Myxococcus stipitatus DSM 14675]